MTKRDDVHDFDVERTPADDFVRISINNYWPMSKESPADLIANRLGQADSSVKTFLKNYAVQRYDGTRRLGKTLHLRPGRNFVVYELENRTGYRSGAFRLYLNGQELAGLPGGVLVDAKEIRALLGGAIG